MTDRFIPIADSRLEPPSPPQPPLNNGPSAVPHRGKATALVLLRTSPDVSKLCCCTLYDLYLAEMWLVSVRWTLVQLWRQWWSVRYSRGKSLFCPQPWILDFQLGKERTLPSIPKWTHFYFGELETFNHYLDEGRKLTRTYYLKDRLAVMFDCWLKSN